MNTGRPNGEQGEDKFDSPVDGRKPVVSTMHHFAHFSAEDLDRNAQWKLQPLTVRGHDG
jgi:hypothetical protein